MHGKQRVSPCPASLTLGNAQRGRWQRKPKASGLAPERRGRDLSYKGKATRRTALVLHSQEWLCHLVCAAWLLDAGEKPQGPATMPAGALGYKMHSRVCNEELGFAGRRAGI